MMVSTAARSTRPICCRLSFRGETWESRYFHSLEVKYHRLWRWLLLWMFDPVVLHLEPGQLPNVALSLAGMDEYELGRAISLSRPRSKELEFLVGQRNVRAFRATPRAGV
jgi:hypothetical protein